MMSDETLQNRKLYKFSHVVGQSLVSSERNLTEYTFWKMSIGLELIKACVLRTDTAAGLVAQLKFV